MILMLKILLDVMENMLPKYKKIDNIRNNLGKIQSTIAALKNTPDSLQ